jgi:hypothetical protein
MLDGRVDRAFDRFLELPVAGVLGVLWFLGALHEGTFILALLLKGHWSVFAPW